MTNRPGKSDRPTVPWQEPLGASHRPGRHPTGLPRARETHTLLAALAEATLDGTRKEHVGFLVTVPLLIIDDLGMRKLPLTAAEELLEIIMRRYQRASTLLTSNHPVEDWGKLMGDAAPVSASTACCTGTCSSVALGVGELSWTLRSNRHLAVWLNGPSVDSVGLGAMCPIPYTNFTTFPFARDPGTIAEVTRQSTFLVVW